MFATCLFCHAPLGANEMLERFPVGRRLAYDAARGRLWVVCPVCRQWNLSPLDERWEAIDAAERLYRETRLRVATDNVGLARLRDGTELVRIGEPLRPEFAAWRYGERFTLRLRRYAVQSAILGGGALALGLAGPLAGVGFTTIPHTLYSFAEGAIRKRRVVVRLADDRGPLVLTQVHAINARVIPAPRSALGWYLSVPHLRADTAPGRLGMPSDPLDTRVDLTGELALEAVRRLLPVVNRQGARQRTVGEAVKVLEESGDQRGTFLRATVLAGVNAVGAPARELGFLPAPLRLALEMAAHEEVERRALEGELTALEAAWREAEEVAAIADTLTLPEWVSERLQRLQGG